VQGKVGRQVAVVEHPVVTKSADARERPARLPGGTRIVGKIGRGVPPMANPVEVAIAPGEPQFGLIPACVAQLSARGDAAELADHRIEAREATHADSVGGGERGRAEGHCRGRFTVALSWLWRSAADIGLRAADRAMAAAEGHERGAVLRGAGQGAGGGMRGAGFLSRRHFNNYGTM